MNTKKFTEKYYTSRKHTNSIKWDSDNCKGKLPMYIADMDFKCDDKIIDSLQKVIAQGTYGYSFLPLDYNKRLIDWYSKRHNIVYKEEWIKYSKGAVDALFQIIHSLTKKNDYILLATPVYPKFFNSIKEAERRIVCSKMVRNNNHFVLDYDDFEKKIIKYKVKIFVLCTPQNPLSKLWTKNELNKILAITHKHNVIVVSDEVHSDLAMPGYKFIPTLSLKKYQNDVIAIASFSKTFSLAAFSFSHIIIPNDNYRKKIEEHQIRNHLQNPIAYDGYPSYFGIKYATKWLENSINVIYDNYLYVKDRLTPYLEIPELQATYLLFIDFSKYTDNAYEFLYNKCDIVANAGETFGEDYKTWARLNIATSKENLVIACDRIIKAINKVR